MKKVFLFFVLFLSNYLLSQVEPFSFEDSKKLDDLVYELVVSDKIIDVHKVLDSVQRRYKKNENELLLTSLNYNFSILFLFTGDYKKSISFLNKAVTHTKKIPEKYYKYNLYTLQLRVYRESKNYKQLDSLYPIVLARNQKENYRSAFFNYNDYSISLLDRKKYKEASKLILNALNEIKNYEFFNETERQKNIINEVLVNEFKLNLAISFLELKKESQKILRLINEIEKDSLNFVDRERNFYLQKLYKTKSKYYYQFVKNIDSVFYFNELANHYQLVSSKEEKMRASIGANVFFELAAKEKENEQLRLVFKKNELIKTNYFYIIVLVLVLFLVSLVFVCYILIAKKKIKNKNEKLLKKNNVLENIDKERYRFFSIVSHELRTPIYTIKGLTELIEKSTENEQNKKLLNSLKFTNEHLQALVNNALEFSKFSLGNIRLNEHGFYLNELLNEIEKIFSYQLSVNKNELLIEISDDVPVNLYGDSTKLSQIFINLISNANKFTERGKINIEVSKTDEDDKMVFLLFKVSDNGIGIKEEIKSNIFDGFRDVKHINKHKGGSGLGLYIVKKILVNLFNSEIKFKSEEGKGTQFEFLIMFKKNLEVEKETIEKKSGANFLKGKKILVVDDNELNLMITQKILEARESECLVCNNGKDAIKKIELDSDFDFILLDIHMPEMDGIQVAKEIRKFNESLPIIALTAVDLENSIEEIFYSGMDGVITKPFNKDEFFLKIFNILWGKNKI